MMNETFTVAAIADCALVLDRYTASDDFLWRETEVGCKVLLLLQEMYKFNITYIGGPEAILNYYARQGSIYEIDQAVDIYAKPRTLWSSTLYNASPILPVFKWKFGFTLRRPESDIQHFYSLPFSFTVWYSLFAMILLTSVLFYILNCAEQRLLGGNLGCYFSHELLIAIGACCQHYLPVNPMELTSRRIAFFSFFLFCYIIYCYYTSTLLRDLVQDRDSEVDLETLAGSSYSHVVLESVYLIIKVLIEQLSNNKTSMTPEHISFIKKKLTDIRVVNMSTGLAEVKSGKTALLSDYTSLYTAMAHNYDNDIICELVEVHFFSEVLKYFFTSKTFKYVEEFKLGTLWAKETGVLSRLLSNEVVPPLLHAQCATSNFQAHMDHVKTPLSVLAFSYVLCLLVMLGERIYFERHRVWPYVE